MISRFKKILVANRGEIAVRIFRTCREMGIRSVAVYSDADAGAKYLDLADEAYPLGGSTAMESYLNQQKIITTAQTSGSQAIHPGYGFLSENEDFAALVKQEGLTFIGPSPEVIKSLGDKTAARALATKLGIPVTPGSVDPVESLPELSSIASRIGYPILIKAAGGGGGKGMRVVNSETELEGALRGARSEARSAFDDDRIYVEKYIDSPRHVEVQILADQHGNVIHLGERECSIQRRHQKIIEESPSVAVNEAMRRALVESAVKLARESRYSSAGTVEFLLDGEGNYYFLEVNTRLQVEHPVTEMRTGIDIVREQIRIAQNEPLGYTQEAVAFRGNAIECRIYAEDPAGGFLPSTGRIVHLRAPGGGNIREERAIQEGDIVSAYYDPLLSKLVAWGETRAEALGRMTRALEEYELFGVRNNLKLCCWVIDHPKFKRGKFSTKFLEAEFTPEALDKEMSAVEPFAAFAAVHASNVGQDNILSYNGSTKMGGGWLKKRGEAYR